MRENVPENILDTACRILELGPICDSCLGRQFAMLSTGMTNSQRGHSIKITLAMEGSRTEDEKLLDLLGSSFKNPRPGLGKDCKDDIECWVCLGEMSLKNLNEWADRAIHAMQGIDCKTFLVGTIISGLLAENEELLLAEGRSKHAETFKSELNREVGKIIASKTSKQVDFYEPDLLVHLNLETREVDLWIAPLFLYGRYRKLIRGIPQTRWPCRVCYGKGCERCNGTGKMYKESVDELIRPAIIEQAQANDIVFHGAGREDIDARMLGKGRPFVVEVVRPKVRSLDIAALQLEINKRASGKVEVLDLVKTKPKQVELIKEAAYQKTYCALVELDKEIEKEKLKSVLKELVGAIDQQTPTRVSHRRANKLRIRKVYSIDLIDFTGRRAHIIIRADGGLYIKELISGDGGRTTPSLANVLGIGAIVSELDVIDVGGELNGKLSWNSKEDQGQAEQNG
ncbi:MAG: tRNA pseudouridine(54/55) synthase Pus10 [Methanotrichaceae archaeon]|nr:tRNA pseudouridine(54/55) synthase Pus10 [Methanotrichaceae archaeon]